MRCGGSAPIGVSSASTPGSELNGHSSPGNDNIHHLLTPRYDPEASRTRMAVQVRREEKSAFVAQLEEVLPLLRERFGVTKVGIFGSTARGDDRPESDVDVLVELSPDHLTFRIFQRLPIFWRSSTGGRSTCSPSEGSVLSSDRMWRARWSGVRHDEIFLRHTPHE